jgi:hypothetical protein
MLLAKIVLLVLLESIRDYGRTRAIIALLANIHLRIQVGFHIALTVLQAFHLRDQRNFWSAFAPLVNMMSLEIAQIVHPDLTAS